jgi:hypothetical protein
MPVLAADFRGTGHARAIPVHVSAGCERDRLRMQRFAVRLAPRFTRELIVTRAVFCRPGGRGL